MGIRAIMHRYSAKLANAFQSTLALVNLNRKALISVYPTAILAFRPSITHHTPSVFDADQRGIGEFFLSGLGT